MAEEYEKYAVMRNLFRRRSSTEFTGTEFSQLLEVRQVPSILNEMGSRIDPVELKRQIDQLDGKHFGRLTFDQYQQLCDRFVQEAGVSKTTRMLRGYSDFDS